MNRQNIQVSRVAYPNQSYNSALAAPSNQQLLIHSLAACNGSAAPMAIALGHSITSDQVVHDSSIGTTDGDDLLISAKEIFGLVAFNVSQAEAGSPVYTFEYYNGSGYSTLELISTPSFATTGQKCLVFNPPIDWAADGDGFYEIKITATTAPSQEVLISLMKVCRVISYRESIPSKGELLIEFDPARQLLLQVGEEIIPFFAFSSSSNIIEASYQINP